VLLLPLVPIEALGLPPYWLHLSIGVGIIIMLYVLTHNPVWRYLRAYSMLISFLAAANTLSAFKITVQSEGWVKRWSQEDVPWHLNIVLGVLSVVLIILDILTHWPSIHHREEAFEAPRDNLTAE